jgi:hypothetical protein
MQSISYNEICIVGVESPAEDEKSSSTAFVEAGHDTRQVHGRRSVISGGRGHREEPESSIGGMAGWSLLLSLKDESRTYLPRCPGR